MWSHLNHSHFSHLTSTQPFSSCYRICAYCCLYAAVEDADRNPRQTSYSSLSIDYSSKWCKTIWNERGGEIAISMLDFLLCTFHLILCIQILCNLFWQSETHGLCHFAQLSTSSIWNTRPYANLLTLQCFTMTTIVSPLHSDWKQELRWIELKWTCLIIMPYVVSYMHTK